MAQAEIDSGSSSMKKRKCDEFSDESSDDFGNDSESSLIGDGFKAKKNVKRLDGCNIHFKRKDGIYSWRSDKFPNYTYFLDLKIWSPAKRAKGDPLEAWKEANFRAKLAFGNPMDSESKANADSFVKTLKRYITTQADSFDRIEKNLEPYKRKKK